MCNKIILCNPDKGNIWICFFASKSYGFVACVNRDTDRHRQVGHFYQLHTLLGFQISPVAVFLIMRVADLECELLYNKIITADRIKYIFNVLLYGCESSHYDNN